MALGLALRRAEAAEPATVSGEISRVHADQSPAEIGESAEAFRAGTHLAPARLREIATANQASTCTNRCRRHRPGPSATRERP